MLSRTLVALTAVALVLTLALASPSAAGPSARESLTCRVTASFSPSRGNPVLLRVRFHVTGFRGRKPVYLHYIAPGRHFAKTVGLGYTSGACGSLTSSLRRLFPFRTVRAGTWRLQFDTHGPFDHTPRAPFVVLRVPVVSR